MNYTPENPIFFSWTAPTGVNGIGWRHQNIRPIARTFVTAPFSFSPPGYPTRIISSITQYPLPTGQLREYAMAAAEVTAQHFHKQGLTYGNGAFNSGTYDGAFFIQNFGCYTGVLGYDVTSLVGHPHDKITNTTFATRLASGLPPTSTRISYGGITGTVNCYPYTIASGIAECKLYMEYFADSLKTILDASGLCYPKFCAWDYEDAIDTRMIYNFVSVSGQVGNYRNMQLDPRYSTETIYYDRLGATGLTPVTFSGWWNTQITGIINFTKDIFDIANSGACQRMMTASFKNLDYGLYKSVYEPLKARFPNIICSNYGIVQTSGGYPLREYTVQSWMYENNNFILGDASSHSMYAVEPSSQNDQYKLLNESDEQFSIRANADIANVMHSGISDGKMIIPWPATPNLYPISTSGHGREILYEAYKKNISTFFLFNPNVSDSHTVAAVENYIAYIKHRATGYQGLY